MSKASLGGKYQDVKAIAKRDLKSEEVSAKLAEITRDAFSFITTKCRKRSLVSMVPDKAYSSFGRGTKLSRPVNDSLFILDRRVIEKYLNLFESGQLGRIPPDEINRSTTHATLPTDFVFDLGPDRAKLHLPVKTSTRERVIQVWAHQKIIDGVYGAGRFKGILVILTETKLNLESREVVEICLPDQWRAYQMYIARLERVYYLDVPAKYAALAGGYPNIDVKMLGEFFAEKDRLIA